jgi:hypothetical protein
LDVNIFFEFFFSFYFKVSSIQDGYPLLRTQHHVVFNKKHFAESNHGANGFEANLYFTDGVFLLESVLSDFLAAIRSLNKKDNLIGRLAAVLHF